MRIAILDDYTNVAKVSAPWGTLKDVTIDVVNTSLMETDAERIKALKPFDVIVAMRERTALPASVLDELAQLKLLVTTGMRNPSIDMAAARANGVDVCGTEMTPYAAFEHSWALLMSLAKQIPAEHRAMALGDWQKFTGVGLNGKTIGLLGLGKLGAKTAQAAQAFDMNIIAWSRNLTDERATEHGATRVEKDALFQQADFIAIHMVLGDETRGLVGARELGLMKPSAYLINTSRGPLVDEAALIAALCNRDIAGAGLDVYDVEPLPSDHPLRSLDNVVLTGHTGYVIQEMFEIAYGQAVENIIAWQASAPLRLLN